MSQTYRLKISRPALKLRVSSRIPAQLVGANFITITKANGVYTFDVDYTVLTPGPIADPTTAYIAIHDQTAGVYKNVALSSLLTSSLDADLQAIGALTGTGILARTADGTWALRTLTAPAAGITITNPAGVAGNPTLVLANDLAAVEGLAANGMAARTATDTWTVRTITAGASIGVTNGDGVAGNPTVAVTDVELLALGGLTSAADQLPYFTGSGTASLATFTAFARTLVDDATQAAMRTTLGLTPGTDVQAFDSDLAALAANAGTGLWAVTGAGTGSVRTLTAPAAGITVTNPAGTAGNPTLVLANDLAALEGLASTGFAARTATDTWAQRTLQVPAAGLTVSNPAGVAGDPTFALANDLAALEGLSGTNTIYYRSATDTWTAVTIGSGLTFTAGSLAATGGGGTSTPGPPQGRLCLLTAEPVHTVTRSAKTTIFYTPYVGNQIPIWDGTTMTMTTFPEISVATTDTTKNPAAVGASKVNDWFVWNDAGTLRLSHGPDWTSDTARSAGTALVMVNGILLNNASITNGPAASRGTYVGTTRSNGSSQLDWIFGGIAAGGTAGFFGVWNTYNRVLVSSTVGDSTANWAYNTGTWRAANNSATARISYVCGLAEDPFMANYAALASTATSNIWNGIGYDSTSAFSGLTGASNASGIGSLSAIFSTTSLGFHFMSAIEYANATTSGTYYGNASAATFAQSGLIFDARM